MPDELELFEGVARLLGRSSPATFAEETTEHPFDARNIFPNLPRDVRTLFDNGHCAQATFEAFKFIDNEVQRHAKSTESGTSLMMQAFGGTSPAITLTPMISTTEKGEQEGFKFIFAGTMLAIRNPRGHAIVRDDPDTCLDHLSLASMLLRRLGAAGLK